MKKSEYTRATAECRFTELKPKFVKYLKNYLETHNLKIDESEIFQCFETTNLKKGFFGGTKVSYTIMCVTKRFLFWGTITDKEESGIAAAQWADISEIWDWETSEHGKIIEDHGIRIFGFIYLSSHRAEWFIGLGDDEAGKRCRTLFKEMIIK
jgi:hypothetical protein